jgi:hypothetical protein
MALNFDTNAYYRVNQDKRNAENQNTYAPLQSANEAAQSVGGIGQDLQAMKAREQQQQMAQFLMQQKKKQQDQEQQKFNSDYGQPIDPNEMSVGTQAQPMLGKSSFMPGGQGQVASPSPLIDRFKQWQSQGMPKQTAESDFMPALSKDERQNYQKTFTQQKPQDILNYGQAKLIVPTLDEKSFNASYPNGIPREHLAMMSKPQALSTMNTSTYATAPADDQRLARNLVDGKIRPSDIGYRDRGRIVSLASEYADSVNKPFQSFGGDVNAGMAKNLAYGKMGQNVVSFNTALGHIGDASKAFKSVGNTDQRWLNTPLNKLKKQTNDPNVIALDLNLHAVAGELATAFKGSGGTDQEISHFANLLTDDLTPAQAHASLQKAAQLLNSRINAMQNQQSSVRASNGGQRDLLSPHGADVMDQMQKPNQDLMWQGKQLKDTPANRAWLQQRQGGQQ